MRMSPRLGSAYGHHCRGFREMTGHMKNKQTFLQKKLNIKENSQKYVFYKTKLFEAKNPIRPSAIFGGIASPDKKIDPAAERAFGRGLWGYITLGSVYRHWGQWEAIFRSQHPIFSGKPWFWPNRTSCWRVKSNREKKRRGCNSHNTFRGKKIWKIPLQCLFNKPQYLSQKTILKAKLFSIKGNEGCLMKVLSIVSFI